MVFSLFKPRPQPVGSPTYRKNPAKYSPYRGGARPEGFKEMLVKDGPAAVETCWPWETVVDPYLAADVKQEELNRAIRAWDNRTYYTLEDQSGLKRQKALHGDSRWTHMKRCNSCEHDNVCQDRPGVYQCQNVLFGRRCAGAFEVTRRDAACIQNMPTEQRVPYSSIGDRYDYDALRKKNMARTRAMAPAKYK